MGMWAGVGVVGERAGRPLTLGVAEFASSTSADVHFRGVVQLSLSPHTHTHSIHLACCLF